MIELRGDWSEAILNMQREMGRLMDEVVSRKPPSVRFSPGTWQPAVDVYETAHEVVVLVELAGASEDEIEVTMQNGTLIIKGTRRDSRQGVSRTYSRMEISWGPFERDILIPANVDVDRVKAFYEAGMLEVVLPKLGAKSSRRVNIRKG